MGALKNTPGSRFPYRPNTVQAPARLAVWFVIGLLVGGYLATL